jgi:hypothetical protein
MIRSLLVYDYLCTCSTTSTTCLDYNPSWDRLRLDGFIDCSSTSGHLLNAWTRGLAPPFCYNYFMPIICLLLRGLMRQGTQRASRDSSHAYMLDDVQLLDNARSKRLFKICLGFMFVNHYFKIFIPK